VVTMAGVYKNNASAFARNQVTATNQRENVQRMMLVLHFHANHDVDRHRAFPPAGHYLSLQLC